MTYTAPRQGLFAIIILISFILHSVLMVFGLEQQLNANREHKAEQLIAELVKTTGMALYKDDRVSLSVIADRYGNETDVTRLTLLDNAGNILVQTGNAPLQTGKTYSQPVLVQNHKVGDVELTIKRTSKGEMVRTLWPFELGALILHLLVWLLYGYVARPTKSQLQQLSRDVHDYYVMHYDVTDNKQRPAYLFDDDKSTKHNNVTGSTDTQSHGSVDNSAAQDSPTTDHQSHQTHGNIGSQVSQFLQKLKTNEKPTPSTSNPPQTTSANTSQASVLASNSASASSTVKADDNDMANDKEANNKTAIPQNEHHAFNPRTSNSSTANKQTFNNQAKNQANGHQRPFYAHADTPIVVAFMFADEHRLLNKLSPQVAQPYLTLCNDLLSAASEQLLRLPAFQGASLQRLEPFTLDAPARMTLSAKQGFDNANSKLAQASVMLAMLCMMLNKIIFDKHRELKRFALPINVAVAHTEQIDPMVHVVNKRAQEHQTYILLSTQELMQINRHIQLTHLNNPKSVYERECLRLIGADDDTVNRLAQLRNNILTAM